MDRVFQSGAIATPPSPPNSETSKGYPTNGSASGGVAATIVGDHWYHGITEELLNAIKGGGVTPDINQLDQLNRSIENRINQRFDDLKKALDQSVADVMGRVGQLGIPTGAIMAFDLNGAPNDGFWLPCDGRAVSRQTYAALFAAIGTRHGAGDGRTTFHLPNLNGLVLQGANGGNVGQQLAPAIPNIYGTFVASPGTDSAPREANGVFAFDGQQFNAAIKRGGSDNWASRFTFDASRSSGVYKNGVNTVQPPAMLAYFCIHI